MEKNLDLYKRIEIVDNCFKKDEDLKKNTVKNGEEIYGLMSDNRGIGVVEIVLILVVLVALVIIFKDKIMEIINDAFSSISSGADSL